MKVETVEEIEELIDAALRVVFAVLFNVAARPLLLIWSANALFHCGIPLAWRTWFAAWVLLAAVRPVSFRRRK